MSSDLTFITNEQGKHLGDRFGVLLADDTPEDYEGLRSAVNPV